HRLLSRVQETGAKLLVVGDNHQFKAIEAGDFFRKFVELTERQGRLSSLETIQRQKEPWMREASIAFSELKTYQGLAQYENHGCVEKIASNSEGLQTVAKNYVEKGLSEPQQSGLLLASTRAQCQELNLAVREELKNRGLMIKEDIYING